MKNIHIKKPFEGEGTRRIVVLTGVILLIYLFVSAYFAGHFFFNTVINGVDVSLKAHDGTDRMMKSYIEGYELQLIERNGETEKITGRDIGLHYNEQNSMHKIYPMQNPFKWIGSLFQDYRYYVNDLFIYEGERLENKINESNCLNKDMTEPRNVSFRYSNGSYEMLEEIYGNKIIRYKLEEAIKTGILSGEKVLDLDEKLCYENPKYTLSSDKALKTKRLLDRYVSANITYKFGDKKEILDGSTINEWLSVDENLEAVISKEAVMKYVSGLGKKYDTVGVDRNFKTSIGKKVEIKGGLYGWKINRAAETKALLENISLGEVLEKEPIYAQKALSRDGNEIGNTYVEINITRQHIWFYKNGRLMAQGSVVTGNPNRGCSTVVGAYMLNYKQKYASLIGADYEAEVTYWMPFYGNTGIHDATWRHSFGGDIYKRNGTHGCVNAPLYLAKRIFENIEDGTPIICYEE